jgi:hypothetical protein
MTRIRTGLLLAALAGAVTFGTAGCNWDSHTDAPTPNAKPGTHAHVIKMPDGFRNVSVSCDGTNGVYVTSAGADDTLPSSVYVVVRDPNCG